MPIYHFNVYDGFSSPDLDGTEVVDIYTVQDQAIRLSGELLRDMGAKFWDSTEWRLEVTDAVGEVLFLLHFTAEERAGLRAAVDGKGSAKLGPATRRPPSDPPM